MARPTTTEPVPDARRYRCGRDRFHQSTRPGYYHCHACGDCLPVWAFYANRKTGRPIGGCKHCRCVAGRGRTTGTLRAAS